ncbi:MAG TPA: GTPase ObgE [Candidatus Dormibacteraeota bacterium]|jgi:GTP-binding protein|nr:GTPase ObgE [Candidatus Dormibacteraeota bacterium]
MFLDEVRIRVRSGAGGPGAVTFRREKYVPKGGPDGGDGGRGGDVYLVGSNGVNSLSHFSGHTLVAAERGGSGARSLRHGADADDVRVLVPIGTVVMEEESGDVIGEIRADGDELRIARGGRGGRGNAKFAGSRRQAPRFAELGDPSEERELRLELRLIADVGLVGAPNAGKSTLLGALTAANPKVAGYPFTTLEPNLGVVEYPDGSRLTLADIPGLIEGAAGGAGLGTDFLKHIGRAGVLVHVVDCSTGLAAARESWRSVIVELEGYDPELPSRVRIAALNKIDLPGAELTARELAAELESPRTACYLVSAEEGTGLDELTEALASADEPPKPLLQIYRPEPVAARISVRREGDGFRVKSRAVERIVARADLGNPEALARMRRQLAGAGLRQALMEAGAEAGDTVMVGDTEFLFDPEL